MFTVIQGQVCGIHRGILGHPRWTRSPAGPDAQAPTAAHLAIQGGTLSHTLGGTWSSMAEYQATHGWTLGHRCGAGRHLAIPGGIFFHLWWTQSHSRGTHRLKTILLGRQSCFYT